MKDLRKLLLNLIYENKIDVHDALEALLDEVPDSTLEGFLYPYINEEEEDE